MVGGFFTSVKADKSNTEMKGAFSQRENYLLGVEESLVYFKSPAEQKERVY